MKKVLSIVLAIAMIASMSVVAFAAAGNTTIDAKSDSAASIPVNGVYAGDGMVPTWKIDIAWDDFTYTYTSGKVWNPTTYTWDLDGEGTWAISAKKINFTNHSADAINVSAEYTGKGKFTFADGGVIAGAAVLDGADYDEYATGESKTGYITATFDADGYTIANNEALGTITVKVA